MAKLLSAVLLAVLALGGCSGPFFEHDSTGIYFVTFEWPCEQVYPSLRGDLCWTSYAFDRGMFLGIQQGGPWS